jgi:hypothetical protein
MSLGGQLLEPPGIKLPRLDLEQVAPSPGEQRRGPCAIRTTVREQLAQAVKLDPGRPLGSKWLRHKHVVRVLLVVAEWTAILEAVLDVKTSGRFEEFERSRLEEEA